MNDENNSCSFFLKYNLFVCFTALLFALLLLLLRWGILFVFLFFFFLFGGVFTSSDEIVIIQIVTTRHLRTLSSRIQRRMRCSNSRLRLVHRLERRRTPRREVPLPAASNTRIILVRTILHQVILRLANLTTPTIHVHPFFIPRTRSAQVSRLPAHKALGVRVIRPRLVAVIRRVILGSTIVTRLFPSVHRRRPAFDFPTVPYRVSGSSASETRQFTLPYAPVRRRRSASTASAARSPTRCSSAAATSTMMKSASTTAAAAAAASAIGTSHRNRRPVFNVLVFVWVRYDPIRSDPTRPDASMNEMNGMSASCFGKVSALCSRRHIDPHRIQCRRSKQSSRRARGCFVDEHRYHHRRLRRRRRRCVDTTRYPSRRYVTSSSRLNASRWLTFQPNCVDTPPPVTKTTTALTTALTVLVLVLVVVCGTCESTPRKILASGRSSWMPGRAFRCTTTRACPSPCVVCLGSVASSGTTLKTTTIDFVFFVVMVVVKPPAVRRTACVWRVIRF